MDESTRLEIMFLKDNIQDTIYGYLLANHSLNSINLSDLKMPTHSIRLFKNHQAEINEIAKDFYITDDKIIVLDTALSSIKLFLFKQLVMLISPKNYFTTDIDFAAFMGRYVTFDSYDKIVKNVFNAMIEKLYNLKIQTATEPDNRVLNIFEDLVAKYRRPWLNIISDLLNGKLTRYDIVTDYFSETDNLIKYISWMKLTEFPTIIAVKNKDLIVSNTYFQDNTVLLQYLIPLFHFPFTPQQILHSILLSCI